MSVHTAKISWTRNEADFTDNKYSRVHRWTFDGGAVVPASSSPHVVRIPFSDPTCVDPEEAFVASLSSCHMLWFLGLAAREGYIVDSYTDEAEGKMETNTEGKQVITKVTLRPVVVIADGKKATDAAVEQLHHDAHENCFLASSVKSEICIVGSWRHS
jgi:organic hydroperoxide reductase OsmC/OhrA